MNYFWLQSLIINETEKNENDDKKLYDKKLKQTLTDLNENPTINNVEQFGPLTNDSIVIVVQVRIILFVYFVTFFYCFILNNYAFMWIS